MLGPGDAKKLMDANDVLQLSSHSQIGKNFTHQTITKNKKMEPPIIRPILTWQQARSADASLRLARSRSRRSTRAEVGLPFSKKNFSEPTPKIMFFLFVAQTDLVDDINTQKNLWNPAKIIEPAYVHATKSIVGLLHLLLVLLLVMFVDITLDSQKGNPYTKSF